MIRFSRPFIFNSSKIKFGIYLLTIIMFISVSCSNKKKETANSIIENFISEKAIDNRETVFNINAEEINGDLVIVGETDKPALKNEILSQLAAMGPEDKITILPDSTVGNKTFGLVNLSVANLRTKPNHSAELATQALLGTPIKILKKKDGWFLVQTPDNYISWIDDDGIFALTEAKLSDWKNSERIIFTGDNQIAYQSEDAVIPVSDITLGNILEKTGETRHYFKIKFPDGRFGFVTKDNWLDFNQFKNSVKPDTSVIRTMAIDLTGRPYLWGGTSNRAMDCSGFVKVIYFMNGLILPRDASLQTQYGALINSGENYKDFRTGDLLFFGRKADENQAETVTHVALSLGETEYIHASGRIRRNSFNSESDIYSAYRKNSFVRARRVIGSAASQGIIEISKHPWY